jgi:hypothetical protein
MTCLVGNTSLRVSKQSDDASCWAGRVSSASETSPQVVPVGGHGNMARPMVGLLRDSPVDLILSPP